MVPYPYNSVRNCGQYLGYFVIINKQQAAYRQAVIFMCLSMEDIILHLTSPLAPVKDKWFPISELIVDNCEHYWNHSNQWFIIHTSQRQIISSVFSYNWYTPLSLIWISLNIESAAVSPARRCCWRSPPWLLWMCSAITGFFYSDKPQIAQVETGGRVVC